MKSNPFNFTGPAEGARFFGRRVRVEGIAADLADWSGASHAIIAGLHMGKSSLLRAIEAELRSRLEDPPLTGPRVLPVYVSFHAMAAAKNEQEVLGFILLRICQTLSGQFAPVSLKSDQDTLGRLKSLAHAGQSSITFQTLEGAVGEVVALLEPLLGPVRIALLVESIENAAGAAWIDYLFDNLNALVHDGELRNHVRLVLTGAERLLAIKQRGSPLLTRLRLHFLEPLPEEDVIPLLALAPEIPAEAHPEIMSLAGGHPFILQHLMHFLWEGGAEYATLETVAVEAQRFIDDRSADLERWWSSVGDDGHRVYCLLRQTDSWLPRNEIIKALGPGAESALKRLLYYGLIRHDGSFKKYRIYGRIFSDWCGDRCAALAASPKSGRLAEPLDVPTIVNASQTASPSSFTIDLPDSATTAEERQGTQLVVALGSADKRSPAYVPDGGGQRRKEMRDFFITYNKADRAWAEWIAWVLEEAGYSVVIQAWDFRPGENFVLKMHRAAAETNKTIAVLSNSYLNALYTQAEWAAAFSSDPTGQQRQLVPVRVEPCEPAGLLSSLIYIDIVGASEQDARLAILGAFSARSKPSRAPRFPGEGPDVNRHPAVPFPGEPSNTTEGNLSDAIIATTGANQLGDAKLTPRLDSVPNASFSMNERLALAQNLSAIPPQQFNMIVFALDPPPGIIPPMPTPQGDRAHALLEWAKGPGGCSLHDVQTILNELLVPAAEVHHRKPKPAASESGVTQGEARGDEGSPDVGSLKSAEGITHDESTSRADNNGRLGVTSPLAFLREAVAAVPAVKYALGVGGGAAVIAIIAGFKLDYTVAVFGVIILFGLMFVLVIFSKFSETASESFKPLALVLAWTFVVLTVVVASLLVTSFFWDWPRPLDQYIQSSSSVTSSLSAIPAATQSVKPANTLTFTIPPRAVQLVVTLLV